jgi:hypothetical protein
VLKEHPGLLLSRDESQNKNSKQNKSNCNNDTKTVDYTILLKKILVAIQDPNNKTEQRTFIVLSVNNKTNNFVEQEAEEALRNLIKATSNKTFIEFVQKLENYTIVKEGNHSRLYKNNKLIESVPSNSNIVDFIENSRNNGTNEEATNESEADETTEIAESSTVSGEQTQDSSSSDAGIESENATTSEQESLSTSTDSAEAAFESSKSEAEVTTVESSLEVSPVSEDSDTSQDHESTLGDGQKTEEATVGNDNTEVSNAESQSTMETTDEATNESTPGAENETTKPKKCGNSDEPEAHPAASPGKSNRNIINCSYFFYLIIKIIFNFTIYKYNC